MPTSAMRTSAAAIPAMRVRELHVVRLECGVWLERGAWPRREVRPERGTWLEREAWPRREA